MRGRRLEGGEVAGRTIVAALYERDCGATSPFVTLVSLRPAGTTFDHDRFPPIFVRAHARAADQFSIRWENYKHLVVERPLSAEHTLGEQSWRDVSVTYADPNKP